MKGKIFNTQEVQAIISGNKRMFREAVKRPLFPKIEVIDGKRISHPRKCPYRVGQKIFCKESFNIFADQVCYKQSLVDAQRYFWKPAQHMKQEQSRLTLQIIEIRAERLAEISEEDCWRAGLEEFADYQDSLEVCQMANKLGECVEDPRPTFAVWWNATHKKPEEKFEANPWVWVLEFELVENNL
jgi:hypothetical protein